MANFKEIAKKLGVAAFLFFLIKGLIWIGVILYAGKTIKNCPWWQDHFPSKDSVEMSHSKNNSGQSVN